MKKYLQAVYLIWSKIYDNLIDKTFSFDRKKAIEFLKIEKGSIVLEIGVGTGLNLPYYPECIVHGIDFSSAMLAKAKMKKSLAEVHLHEMDARKLEFPNEFFDKSIMTYTLRVTPEPRKVLEEAYRVLKNNGILVIVDQFKTKSKLLKLVQPIKILLGWGKEYALAELIFGMKFEMQHEERCGRMNGTKIMVLKKY